MLRSSRRRIRRLVVAPVVCALTLPAAASATGNPGLHVDPASPVAKAYALPLDGVRGASSGSANTAKLFGSGISRVAEPGRSAARRIQGTATPASYTVLEPRTSSGLAWMAIVAVVVLAIGSAGALALRRRR